MTHGSLFTGIGGFDLGFERAGMQSVWQVENDVKAQQTIKEHFPKVERFEDVRECKGLSSVDVVSGGFPCQDVSVAGPRAGLAGKRSRLWFEFVRILEDIRPRWVVVENVPGLLSSNRGRDFGTVVSGLVELGYGVCWRVLDAQYFGVAQRRRRVFVVGSLGDYGCLEVLFESESVPGNSAQSQETKTEIAHTLRSRSSKSGVPTPGRGGEDDFNIVNCINTDPYADRAAEESKLVMNALDSGQGGPDDNSAQAGHLMPSYWDGSQTSDTLDCSSIANRQMQPEKRRFPCVMVDGVRRLTPTECERLQGFPDGWTKMHKDTVRYRQIGNAVAVPVAEWIGKRIVEAS